MEREMNLNINDDHLRELNEEKVYDDYPSEDSIDIDERAIEESRPYEDDFDYRDTDIDPIIDEETDDPAIAESKHEGKI